MVDPLDDVDPYADDISQTAMGQAQARGDKSYSSIGSAVNVSGDGDSGPSTQANLLALRQIKQQERPSFIERVSGKLSSIYGGRQLDPTGFYRSIPSKVQKGAEKLIDKAIPGKETPLGMLPALVRGPAGVGLSVLNYMAGQDKPLQSFLEKFGIDKKDQIELIPTPTVAQFDPREMNALDPRSLSRMTTTGERPRAEIKITSRGDPVVDIPVEEANPAGLSQLQRSRGGLPVEVRGGGGGSTREGGLGDFVAIASPTSRPDIPVPNYVLDSIARKPPELVNAPNEGLGDMTKRNAPNIGLRPDDFPLEYFAPEPDLGPYEQQRTALDAILQGVSRAKSTPSGGITDLDFRT